MKVIKYLEHLLDRALAKLPVNKTNRYALVSEKLGFNTYLNSSWCDLGNHYPALLKTFYYSLVDHSRWYDTCTGFNGRVTLSGVVNPSVLTYNSYFEAMLVKVLVIPFRLFDNFKYRNQLMSDGSKYLPSPVVYNIRKMVVVGE